MQGSLRIEIWVVMYQPSDNPSVSSVIWIHPLHGFNLKNIIATPRRVDLRVLSAKSVTVMSKLFSNYFLLGLFAWPENLICLSCGLCFIASRCPSGLPSGKLSTRAIRLEYHFKIEIGWCWSNLVSNQNMKFSDDTKLIISAMKRFEEARLCYRWPFELYRRFFLDEK